MARECRFVVNGVQSSLSKIWYLPTPKTITSAYQNIFYDTKRLSNRFKNIIICTNASVDENIKRFLEIQKESVFPLTRA